MLRLPCSSPDARGRWRATLRMASRLVTTLVLLAASPMAAAQDNRTRVIVTGGEHGSFTRIVLQGNRPLVWSLQGDDRLYRLHLQPADMQVDLRRAFDRIARDRLMRIRRLENHIVLQLACDCPIRAFEDRPGVVVLDILEPPLSVPDGADDEPGGDPAAILPATRPTPRAARPRTDGVRAPPGSATSRAGQAVAEMLRHQVPEAAGPHPTLPPLTAMDTPDTEAILPGLALRMAEAVEQGLLTASGAAEPPGPLRPDLRLDGTPGQTGQLRVLSGLRPAARADVTAATDPSTTRHCAPADVLAFLETPDAVDFALTRGALMHRLHGEFDRLDDDALIALVRLHLRHGFGAEARQLIDLAQAPLAGHDVLRGLADLQEDRQSNSRLHLTGLAGCPGPAGLVAALAGADDTAFGTSSDDIVMAYGTLPTPLKHLFGEPLMAGLIEAGAIDQARIVLGMLQNTSPAGVTGPALPEALLNHARGAADAAAATLAAQPDNADVSTLRLRLRLALETGAEPDLALLEQAEDMAHALRRHEEGVALMADVVRLRAAHADFQAGFVALDRTRNWLGNTAEDRAIDQDLTDLMWRSAAETGGDQTFLALFLAREDRVAERLSAETRTALAARLLRLGLSRPAIALLRQPENRVQGLIMAEAHLMADRPEDAMRYLSELPVPTELPGVMASTDDIHARQLMARAMRDLGATETAIVALSASGNHREAARLAIATGDWQAVEAVLASSAPQEASDPDIPSVRLRADDDRSDDPADRPAASPATAETGPSITAEPPEASAGAATSDRAALLGMARAFGSVPGMAVAPGQGIGAAPLSVRALSAARPAIDAPNTDTPDTDSPDTPARAPAIAGSETRDPTTLPPDRSEPPEAALIRRNTVLLEQSEALRSLAETLLADQD